MKSKRAGDYLKEPAGMAAFHRSRMRRATPIRKSLRRDVVENDIRMEMIATDIEQFKNLAEWDLEGTYFDLRKDFCCIAVRYEKSVLVLEFKESASPTSRFSLTCENAELIRINASVKKPAEALTLDNFYRGNYEVNGHLIDVDGVRAYFYLEFYEGPILEFWAEELTFERTEPLG